MSFLCSLRSGSSRRRRLPPASVRLFKPGRDSTSVHPLSRLVLKLFFVFPRRHQYGEDKGRQCSRILQKRYSNTREIIITNQAIFLCVCDRPNDQSTSWPKQPPQFKTVVSLYTVLKCYFIKINVAKYRICLDWLHPGPVFPSASRHHSLGSCLNHNRTYFRKRCLKAVIKLCHRFGVVV